MRQTLVELELYVESICLKLSVPETFFQQNTGTTSFQPKTCKQETYLLPEIQNISQCAVGIVHHFQSEAELDVIITMQVFTRICLPGSGATRWPPIRAVENPSMGLKYTELNIWKLRLALKVYISGKCLICNPEDTLPDPRLSRTLHQG